MEQSSVKIGAKALLVSALIILGLMIVSGVLTRILPAGSFERLVENGRTMVVPGTFSEMEHPDYPVWRWFTAPVEVLFVKGNITLITIILFIICVGGSITILEQAGVMEHLLHRLVQKFARRKYILMAILIFFFMFISSVLGIYEGMVPMIIFIVPLALSLGWDSLTGLGMSLLPLAFGFASAITNPFTLGPAQKIADLPLFSGAWLRVIFFLIVFAVVYLFVSRYARKIEAHPEKSKVYSADQALREKLQTLPGAREEKDLDKPHLKRAFTFFAVCMGLALFVVMVLSNLPGMSDLSFPIMGLLFLLGGLGAGVLSGMDPKTLGLTFLKGAGNLLPGVLLILMAYSVQHIIVSGQIMDTILNGMSEAIAGASPLAAAFIIYGITLVMNFFIGSASAKAFLMMPLLVPLSDMAHITRQTAVLAFDFGDGFSNMIFPTNALLLIALSFTVVSWPKWMAWTAKIQVGALILTALFLVFAVQIGFGPF